MLHSSNKTRLEAERQHAAIVSDGDACEVEVKLIHNPNSGFDYDLRISVDGQTVALIEGLEYLILDAQDLEGTEPLRIQLSSPDNQPT